MSEKKYKVQVIFRVFDRSAYEEIIYDELPLVYNIKRRIKLITGSEKGHDENTTIFKEIIIDNGSRMIIYKYLRPDETRNKTKRFNDELVRTKQSI